MEVLKISWTDKNSIRVIKYLRDKYKIISFVETGTFKGVNAMTLAPLFKYVMTCEKVRKYFKEAKKRLDKYDNVYTTNCDSASYLKSYNIGNDYFSRLFYLDAHFYDKNLPKGKGKFVILKELKALKNYGKCVIVIHDFDNNLGHVTYDGIDLDLKLIAKDLRNVYNFNLYTNTLESCDIMKPSETKDPEMKDNLKYAWTAPRLTYRGLLYALPTKLTKKEMKQLGLRPWN